MDDLRGGSQRVAHASTQLSVGKGFIFSKLTLSNSSSAWGTFVLLLQFFNQRLRRV